MAGKPGTPRVVRERLLMAHCSSSSCEIAFAKAAVREELFRPNIGQCLSDEIWTASPNPQLHRQILSRPSRSSNRQH
jgi:hypothetical protein